MSKFLIYILSVLILASCTVLSIGKMGVYYNEMGKQPEVWIFDEMIVVETESSIRNSALLIYKIKANVDTSSKHIELVAFQALVTNYENRFEVKLKNYTVKELKEYKVYWIDPDKKRHRLLINE